MRRANRERIFEAQRIGFRNGLHYRLRVSEELADAIVAEWLAQAERRDIHQGDVGFWDEAATWIEERLRRR
jgi:hypothetical protein